MNAEKKSKQDERMKNALEPQWISGVNMIQLMRSQRYRLKIAIQHSNSSTEAAELLGISERTYFRWLKKYKIKGH